MLVPKKPLSKERVKKESSLSSWDGEKAPREVAQKRKRGTRLPEDWWLRGECESWGDWAVKEFGWDRDRVISTADKFKDYWLSIPGERGVKLDWKRTWRNWCRAEEERYGVRKTVH